MNAEKLRTAASLMREQHGPEHERHAMWAAMADWLDLMAEDYAPYWSEPYAAPFVPVIEKAYHVADAYLRGAA